MPFEPNTICPDLAAARAARLHKRIAARDLLVTRLSARIVEFMGADEIKGVSGTLRCANAADGAGGLVSPRTAQSIGTPASMADMAAARRSGVRENTRRGRVGA